MAIGQVNINSVNLSQGASPEIERYFLFLARSETQDKKLFTVESTSDFDTLFDDDALKAQLVAARDNGKQNWRAGVYVIAQETTYEDALNDALEQADFEAVVVIDDVTKKADLDALQALALGAQSRHQKHIFILATARAMRTDEAWSDYISEIKSLTQGVAANKVMMTPKIWGIEQGALAGRLCDHSVTVADSPMRVATGPMVGHWTTKPRDVHGQVIDMSMLSDLHAARFSVPQWYANMQGVYWSDGMTLDVASGDFKVIENLRVVQKVMRSIYKLAVARIADRRLNSTPNSIESNKTYFSRPLRDMSKSVVVLGQTFPAEVQPPQNEDITIVWPTRDSVQIYVVVRPYNSPKSITCNILLNLRNES